MNASISRGIKGLWCFAGAFSQGWAWVVHDGVSRIISRTNRNVRFPVSPEVHIVNPSNVFFHPDDLNNFQSFGIYLQALGPIHIGRGTYIAPNVGIITSNHDFSNLEHHLPPQAISIGERSWIGMNSVILPGVTLGDQTIVGAGSVVTKSFPEGHCIIAGSPAKVIRELQIVHKESF